MAWRNTRAEDDFSAKVPSIDAHPPSCGCRCFPAEAATDGMKISRFAFARFVELLHRTALSSSRREMIREHDFSSSGRVKPWPRADVRGGVFARIAPLSTRVDPHLRPLMDAPVQPLVDALEPPPSENQACCICARPNRSSWARGAASPLSAGFSQFLLVEW